MPVKFPAKFSDSILERIEGLVKPQWLVLDPFAGTGRIHELPCETVGIEIEPEWATIHPQTIVGNALDLPFHDETFDAIITSPTYGNRFADHHNAKDGSLRRSYTHDLGRALHPENSGQLHWGYQYRDFHEAAWVEAVRVMKEWFILNISDHIRGGKRMPVTAWHISCLQDLGLHKRRHYRVETPRMRRGENHGLRINHESVILFQRS